MKKVPQNDVFVSNLGSLENVANHIQIISYDLKIGIMDVVLNCIEFDWL